MKQPKITPLRLKGGGEGYILDEDYSHPWRGPDGLERMITVPAGFIYDGASVPRLAWSFSGITPDGLIRPAALIHDFIYRNGGRLPRGCYGMLATDGVWRDLHDELWTREDADRMFGRLMREAGVSQKKRRRAYWGVRAFGWASWKGKK